jgi:hypothetical protein
MGAGVASRMVSRATSGYQISELSHSQIYKVITDIILSVSHFSSIAPLQKQKLPHVGQAIARFISTINHCF